MNYLELLNGLGQRVKPSASAFVPATSLEAPLADTGLDSLDVTLLAVYVCELFGIPEAIGKDFAPRTYSDIITFIDRHGTRVPASLDEAFAVVA